MGKRKRGAKKAVYKITWPDLTTTTMTQAEFEAAQKAGRIVRGTMVAKPGGWYVEGATIGDVFDLD
jgi:hypothetical protein